MTMSEHAIELGDVVEVLKGYADNSFDAVLCDPPYGLSFLGKRWDYDVPQAALWREVLRVCKPGAALIAFSGTRTYHRTVVQIEDAGWEIRDQLAWMYGSGFPKSLDVSKAIDAAAGATREVIGSKLGRPGMSKDGSNQRSGFDAAFGGDPSGGMSTDITGPATDAARAWSGYGTALKPAFEPAVLARKPLEGTVAANVAKWGCGGLAIDACRIGEEPISTVCPKTDGRSNSIGKFAGRESSTHAGRWPANVIMDEEAGAALDAQTGDRPGMSGGGKHKAGATPGMFGAIDGNASHIRGDNGGASRFFYTAKSSRRERNAGVEDHRTWESVDLSRETEELLRLSKGISDDTTQLLSDSEWSTSLCGRLRTDKFQTGFKSTIETVSSLITALRTSNASQPSNIRGSILAATRTMQETGSSPVDCAESIRLLRLSSTDVSTASALDAVNAALLQLSEVSRKELHGNFHSTVKPIALMQYLARLIMPPSPGAILVPFSGSGSEMIGALAAGWPAVLGIERESEYVEIARRRLAHHTRDAA